MWAVNASLSATPLASLIPLSYISNGPRTHRFAPTIVILSEHWLLLYFLATKGILCKLFPKVFALVYLFSDHFFMLIHLYFCLQEIFHSLVMVVGYFSVPFRLVEVPLCTGILCQML
jgi:hypothetical protein